MARAELNWPADRTERLIALWEDGATLDVCAEKLGVSRNAVRGKVHRLRARGIPLANRSSPIKQKAVPHPKPLPLPSMVSVKVLEPPLPEPPPRSVDTCAFPIGEPGTPSFRWCSETVVRGSVYCFAHHSLCYHCVRA